jgi:peptidoglycan/LPS O-acetylase OafA/YrhL
LDGWRAIAILAVMIGHATALIFSPNGALPNARWYERTRIGGLGVDVFFGISGFLICSRLLEERRRSGRINLGKFYVRRSFRILPASFTYLTVVGLLSLAGYSLVSPPMWVGCVLFFRNYLPLSGPGGHYTAHFWSLAIEEHFYFLWPSLLFLCGARRARPLAVVLAFAVATWRVWEFRHEWLAHRMPDVGFFTRTDIRLDGLLWGCFTALVFDTARGRKWLAQWLSPCVWIISVVAFIGCVMFQPPMAMMWQAMLIPLVLVGTVLHPNYLIGKLLETKPMRWIGRLSYSFYLWNSLFFPRSDQSEPLPLGWMQQFPLSIIPVIGCAVLSYYFVERPMIRLGHYLTSQGGPQRVRAVIHIEGQQPQYRRSA